MLILILIITCIIIYHADTDTDTNTIYNGHINTGVCEINTHLDVACVLKVPTQLP